MVNPEHVAKLREGVQAWNAWRAQNPNIQPDLRETDLVRVDLSGADLSGADLSGANLRKANLDWAQLIRANLCKTDLGGANLGGANLSGADLGGAQLIGANLRGADLRGADLNEARLYETIFANVNLTAVKSLDSCRHYGRSTIDYRTLERSGKLPLPFLQGCGLPDTLINNLSSLLNQPSQFYSCFISYSHSDKSFADRLYDRLQNRGIRCWRDEKDMQLGAPMLDTINEAIQEHDKVLLCCSKASLTSTWVEDEIAMTFEKERKYKSLVLIPLDLDTYLFEHWFSGKAPRIRERLAADFTGWEQDNKKFKAQFERVVRALQTDEEARGKP